MLAFQEKVCEFDSPEQQKKNGGRHGSSSCEPSVFRKKHKSHLSNRGHPSHPGHPSLFRDPQTRYGPKEQHLCLSCNLQTHTHMHIHMYAPTE